jgi:hypothetical protein
LFAAILVAAGTIAWAPAHAVGKYGASCSLGGDTVLKKAPMYTNYVLAIWYNSAGNVVNNANMTWDSNLGQYYFSTPTGAVKVNIAPNTLSSYVQVTCK